MPTATGYAVGLSRVSRRPELFGELQNVTTAWRPGHAVASKGVGWLFLEVPPRTVVFSPHLFIGCSDFTQIRCAERWCRRWRRPRRRFVAAIAARTRRAGATTPEKRHGIGAREAAATFTSTASPRGFLPSTFD